VVRQLKGLRTPALVGWKNSDNDELRDLYFSPNVIINRITNQLSETEKDGRVVRLGYTV
jgi:hypothetical protein